MFSLDVHVTLTGSAERADAVTDVVAAAVRRLGVAVEVNTFLDMYQPSEWPLRFALHRHVSSLLDVGVQSVNLLRPAGHSEVQGTMMMQRHREVVMRSIWDLTLSVAEDPIPSVDDLIDVVIETANWEVPFGTVAEWNVGAIREEWWTSLCCPTLLLRTALEVGWPPRPNCGGVSIFASPLATAGVELRSLAR